MIYRKRFVLDQAEREKPCPHTHMPYRARYGMPCTGPRVCSMCGVTDAELREEGEQ